MQHNKGAGGASVLGKRPSAAQQAQQAGAQQASNKRAAADLKARLKRGEGGPGQEAAGLQGQQGTHQEAGLTGRQHNSMAAGAQPDQHAAAPAPAALTGGTPIPQEAAATQRASGETKHQGHQQQQAQQAPAWAAGAPPYLQALAAAGDGTQVVFLGTGSAEPSKYRGASAIHLR